MSTILKVLHYSDESINSFIAKFRSTVTKTKVLDSLHIDSLILAVNLTLFKTWSSFNILYVLYTTKRTFTNCVWSGNDHDYLKSMLPIYLDVCFDHLRKSSGIKTLFFRTSHNQILLIVYILKEMQSWKFAHRFFEKFAPFLSAICLWKRVNSSHRSFVMRDLS